MLDDERMNTDAPEAQEPAADPVPQIISEFSAVFTFVRTRWFEFLSDLHPEMSRGLVPTLLTIERHGRVTATDLTELLRTDKTMVSKQVACLKKQGLVDAVPSEEDRRVVFLSVSPLAEERLALVRGKLADQYRARFSDWSDDEIHALRNALHRFNQSEELTGDSAEGVPSAV